MDDQPLEPGYRFHTEVYGVGERAGAAWDGDLVLKGFGDPTLSTADLDRPQEMDDQPLEPADRRDVVSLLYSVE